MRSIFCCVLFFFSILILFSCCGYAAEYYVSPNGSRGGDGTKAKPWATLGQAIAAVPDDGSTIIVQDGLYAGSNLWNRAFDKTLTVKAENPYRARFTGRDGTNTVLYLEKFSNAVIEGLEFHGNGSDKSDYLVQLGKEDCHHLVFRNCIFHDSYKNDLLKINNRTHDILFTGCIFFNQNNHSGDEHFDINVVKNITIEDSIFFNDYAGSGRPEVNQAHSFIVIKNSSNTAENYTENIIFRRNIFLGWSGLPDQGFILTAEDNKPFFEASGITIENNLFLFHTAQRIIAALLFKGGIRDVAVRANTVTGHPNGGGPGSFSAYSAVFMKFDKQPAQENIIVANNVFCDNTGKMLRFSAGAEKDFAGKDALKFNNNVYWSGGKKIPVKETDVFVPERDKKAILQSPMLPDVPAKIVYPRLDEKTGKFLSGNSTIRQEFERLVKEYAVPAAGSSVIDAADAAQMPKDDILGNKRDNKPDCGCYETR
ncbi:MAG: hypothetical protein FWE67_11490 [Planctomycetaceae bacterium]|nr:hypothetical protein [Planctomycetaceae bacterium]